MARLPRLIRRSIIPLLAASLALSASACHDGGSSSPSTPTAHAMAPGGGVPAPAAQAEQPAVQAVRAFDIGPLVVDGRGFTLYRFDRDTTRPPKSNCEGACAQQWPPMLSSAELRVTNIDQALIGTVLRSDGVEQVTLAGWPLYRYAKDQMPGEITGRGVGGAWYPIAPDGKKVSAIAGQNSAFGL